MNGTDFWDEWRSDLVARLSSRYRPAVAPRRLPATTARRTLPCTGRTSLFFSDRSDDQTEAKALCRDCPHIARCRTVATEHGLAGVWGGTTEAERRAGRTAKAAIEG